MGDLIHKVACTCCGNTSRYLKYPNLHQRDYYSCDNCGLISVGREFWPIAEMEISRYQNHINLESDTKYVAWLNQIIEPMLDYIDPAMIGLDFGCGPNPVLSELLQQQTITCDYYDPFFFPTAIEKRYDFIFCTEVVEHFHNVKEEWARMMSHLKPGGYLAIMTQTWSEATDFSNWYYARDFTHTAFYHQMTMNYLAQINELTLIQDDAKSIFIFIKNIS